MKNFYFECSICPILRDNIVRYVTNTKKIFTPDFIKENYYKHLGYSAVLTFFAIWFLFDFAYLGTTGNFFPIFIGGFGAYCVNYIREWYYGKYYGAPWDGVDLDMGSYGGIIGTIIFLLTLA